VLRKHLRGDEDHESIVGTGSTGERQTEGLAEQSHCKRNPGKHSVYVAAYPGGRGERGMGNKLFAMPWKAFEFAKTENSSSSTWIRRS